MLDAALFIYIYFGSIFILYLNYSFTVLFKFGTFLFIGASTNFIKPYNIPISIGIVMTFLIILAESSGQYGEP